VILVSPEFSKLDAAAAEYHLLIKGEWNRAVIDHTKRNLDALSALLASTNTASSRPCVTVTECSKIIPTTRMNGDLSFSEDDRLWVLVRGSGLPP